MININEVIGVGAVNCSADIENPPAHLLKQHKVKSDHTDKEDDNIKSWKVQKEEIYPWNTRLEEIVPDWDLILCSIRYSDATRANDGALQTIRSKTEYYVSWETLTAQTSGLLHDLRPSSEKVTYNTLIFTPQTHFNLTALNTCLRVIHNRVQLHQIVDMEETYQIKAKKIFHVTNIVEKYRLDKAPFVKWFAEWYKRNRDSMDDSAAASLVFPCRYFDHADGYARATWHMVHAARDQMWSESYLLLSRGAFSWQRIPDETQEELDAVRDHMLAIISTEIHRANQITQNREDCNCRVEGVFKFVERLESLAMWPPEHALRDAAFDTAIQILEDFKSEVDASTCYECRSTTSQFEGHTEYVKRATYFIKNHFDGLCLDCERATRHDIATLKDSGRLEGKTCRMKVRRSREPRGHGPATFFRSIALLFARGDMSRQKLEQLCKKMGILRGPFPVMVADSLVRICQLPLADGDV